MPIANRPLTPARRLCFLILLCACLAAPGVIGALPARAQEEGAKAPAAEPTAEPAAAEPAAATQEAADVPAGAAKTAQVVEKPAQKSRFWWIIESSGLIGGVILLLSIYFVSTVSRLFIEMRQKVATPPEVVDELNDLLPKREFKEIYALVKEDRSFISRVLAAGISELPSGLAEARDAMERVGEGVTVEMEKKISMLAVLGTLGPMIGLLGTLKGMIASFSVIALSDVQLKASEVAGGISEALLLTFEGVALSVPAIYFFALFRNRVSAISVATMLQADEYLRHFAHAARVKTPPAAQVVPKSGKPS
jgi:biopolymer transport protein ExbB